jgi:hypothetical protein
MIIISPANMTSRQRQCRTHYAMLAMFWPELCSTQLTHVPEKWLPVSRLREALAPSCRGA